MKPGLADCKSEGSVGERVRTARAPTAGRTGSLLASLARMPSRRLSWSQWKRCLASVLSLFSLNIKEGLLPEVSGKAGRGEGEGSQDPKLDLSKEGWLIDAPDPAPPPWEPQPGWTG